MLVLIRDLTTWLETHFNTLVLNPRIIGSNWLDRCQPSTQTYLQNGRYLSSLQCKLYILFHNHFCNLTISYIRPAWDGSYRNIRVGTRHLALVGTLDTGIHWHVSAAAGLSWCKVEPIWSPINNLQMLVLIALIGDTWLSPELKIG